jgi:hypothetical protein
MMDTPQNDDPGDELIVLNRYDDIPEAELARGLLESEGIPAFVFGNDIVSTQWLYSMTMGGLRLMVRAQDVTKAYEILGLEPIKEEELEKEAGVTEDIVCPKCGNNNVWRGSSSGLPELLAWVVTFIGPMIGLIPSAGFRCLSCGRVWRVRKPKK